jgi:hypothetical protein
MKPAYDNHDQDERDISAFFKSRVTRCGIRDASPSEQKTSQQKINPG